MRRRSRPTDAEGPRHSVKFRCQLLVIGDKLLRLLEDSSKVFTILHAGNIFLTTLPSCFLFLPACLLCSLMLVCSLVFVRGILEFSFALCKNQNQYVMLNQWHGRIV